MRSSIIVVVCILFAGCVSSSQNQANAEQDLRAAVDKKIAELGRPQLGKTPEEVVRLHYKQPEMYSIGAERVLLERNRAEFDRTFAIDKILQAIR